MNGGKRFVVALVLAAILGLALASSAAADSMGYHKTLPALGLDRLTAYCCKMDGKTRFKTIYRDADPIGRRVHFTACNEAGDEIGSDVVLYVDPDTRKFLFENTWTTTRHVRIKTETDWNTTHETEIWGTWYWTGSRHTP